MPCMGRALQLCRLWFVLSLVPGSALGFGTMGHNIVGYIAEAKMCPAAVTRVRALLEGENLAAAGLWADQIRGYRRYDYAKPWHYINVPDGLAVEAARRNPDGDVIRAIEDMQQRLQDPDLDEAARAEALRFLVHFVADIHQPLHVGRKSDLGGNKVRVRVENPFAERAIKSNLHKYWDSDALNLSFTDPKAYATDLLQRAAPEEGWRQGTPTDWATESAAVRAVVYDLPEGSVPLLDDAYRGRTVEVLEPRLVLAGLRLGALLDDLYCDAP